MAARPFSICFICRGNRFRSPLAQAFVERLTLGLPVQISTAGTLEWDNVPALSEARQIAVLSGVDLSEHMSQRLSLLSLEAVDLVIGFEEEQVRRAIVDARAQQANTFTFREFVRLVRNYARVPESMMVEGARSAVSFAEALRRRDPAATGKDTGMPDPFGRSWKAQLEIAAEIRDLSIELVQHLFGVDGSDALPPIPENIRRRRQWRWRPRWLSPLSLAGGRALRRRPRRSAGRTSAATHPR